MQGVVHPGGDFAEFDRAGMGNIVATSKKLIVRNAPVPAVPAQGVDPVLTDSTELGPQNNDIKNDETFSSTCRKRARKQPYAYTPPLRALKSEDRMEPMNNTPPEREFRWMGCNNRAVSPFVSDESEHLKRVENGSVSPSKNQVPRRRGRDVPFRFEEGQHVWVSMGKAKHHAVVESIQVFSEAVGPETARVRWTTLGTVDEVDIDQLLPMFEEEDGRAVPSSFSRRKRKNTERYAPPRPSKKAKVKARVMQKARKHGKGRKANEAYDAAREEEYEAEGSDEEGNGDSVASSLSRREGINTDRPVQLWPSKKAKERARKHGKGRRASTASNAGRREEVEAGGSDEEANDESVAPSFSRRERKNTDRYAPPWPSKKKAKVEAQGTQNAGKHGGGRKTNAALNAAREEKVEVGGSDHMREGFDALDRVPPGAAPGPGWRSKAVVGARKRNYWISPRDKILFRMPRAAFEFESIRQQCDGDEKRALELYSRRRRAAGKPSYITNWNQIRRVTQGKSSKRALKPNRMTSKESNSESEETTESSDEDENMTLADAKVEQELQKVSEHGKGHRVSTAGDAARKSDHIRENLHAIGRVPQGVAPGPGWRPNSVGGRIYWMSPREEITFETASGAFEFEDIRQQCDGDEKRALELYSKRRRAAGKRSYAMNRKPVRRAHQEKATKKAPKLNRMPSTESNTEAEENAESSDEDESMTLSDAKAKQEMQKASKHGKGHKASTAGDAARKENVGADASDRIHENLHAIDRVPHGIAPGPGWRSKGLGTRTYWMSPREEIIFRTPRAAFEFEDIRRQCDGDEKRALELFSKRRQAVGKRSYITNSNQIRRAIQGKDAKEAPKLNRMTSMETPSNAETEENAESSDERENMTLADAKAEAEYKFLWDYYLKPTIRENEELPSGMVLRRKQASCNLLRCKNSMFRQKLHSKILRLERLGRKDEIRRMLKAVHDHDRSMQSGDLPHQLVEEILGKQASNNGDVEILDSDAIAALQGRNGEGANGGPGGLAKKICIVDVAGGASDSDDESCDPGQRARGSSPPTKFTAAVKTSCQVEQSSVKTSTVMCGEVIDLCVDGDLGNARTVSGMGEKSRHCPSVAKGVTRRNVGNGNASFGTDENAENRAGDQQHIRDDVIPGKGRSNHPNNFQEENQNRIDWSNESSQAENRQSEVIDLSQEEEHLPAMNLDEVIIID